MINANPFMGLLLRMLGQAATQQFTGQVGQGQPGGIPFGDMFGSSQPQDDSPIDVEAEVEEEDGKSKQQKARDQWDATRKDSAHQLGGDVVFAGSKNYNILVGIICVLTLIGGIVYRIYSLVMGNIFSAVVVPVALGVIAAVVLAVVGGVLLYKKGMGALPYSPVDLALVFTSAALMGYGNLIPALLSLLICYLVMHFAGVGKKPPYVLPFAVIAILQFIVFRFPGLYMG